MYEESEGIYRSITENVLVLHKETSMYNNMDHDLGSSMYMEFRYNRLGILAGLDDMYGFDTGNSI